jgi:hypothetical protein
MISEPVPDEKPVRAGELPEAIHENEVVPMFADREITTLAPLQTLCEGGLTVTSGTGFTVTT